MARKTVKINLIQENPANPRTITDDKFNLLVKSLKEFPSMMEKRPVVVTTNEDGTFTALGGNMRTRAAQKAGIEDIPIDTADEWTDEQKKEFIIKDNISFGEWDWEKIEYDWDISALEGWGLDINAFENVNFGDKNKEILAEDLDGKMVLKLEFQEEVYWYVKEKLSDIATTAEEAICKLLKIDE